LLFLPPHCEQTCRASIADVVKVIEMSPQVLLKNPLFPLMNSIKCCAIQKSRTKAMVNLDITDLRILRELQRDANLTNVELAAKVSLSPSPTLARVKRLEGEGVISRYVALVDPHALGLKVNVFVRVSLEKQEAAALEKFEQAVSHFDEVMEVYLMTGDEDYLLRIVVPDIQALERFILENLTRIPGIKNIKSSFALKQVRYKTALPLPGR